MYQRPQLAILQKRIKEARHFIQLISGPRQVGKTTLVKQFLNGIDIPFHFASADAAAPADTIWIAQQWETARLQFARLESREYLLVIDEIQKIENWSEAVKLHWDKDSWDGINIKLILLGSSRLLIQRGLTESLAGRLELLPMTHWSLSEILTAFHVSAEQFVWFGGYPGAYRLIDDENRWKNYIRNSLIETTISKDILMLEPVRKPALLKNLFELSCSYSGQILSYNKMLGQLQEAGNASTLSHYLQLLDSAGLVTGLEKVFFQSIRTKASSPKLQVLNTALISAYKHQSFQDVMLNPEVWGRHVESAIGAHLVNSTLQSDTSAYYWRERNDEVDFVLKKSEKFIGIEVKSGRRKKAPGMRAFADKFKPEKILLVGTGGFPWQEFLMIDPSELF